MSSKVMKPKRDVGIIGYGAYVPRYRIKAKEIARVWTAGTFQEESPVNPPIIEKAVANLDEDSVTMAIEAAKFALKRAQIDPKLIRAVIMGSESKPFAVKTAGVTIGAAIGASKNKIAASYEFACKAGTEAMQTCIGLVGSGMIDYGLAIGSDTAQGRPADALEYTAASGAAAYIIGAYNKKVIAKIEGTFSYTTDTPDFWRREGQKYPRHFARFTGEPAYFDHIINAVKGLMAGLGYTTEDFDYAVFHQPNYKFPFRVGKMLGFPKEKVAPGTLSNIIGNTYAAASLVGLAAVLDIAKPGQRILIASFGSGAGSDAMSILVEEGIEERRDLAPKVQELIERKIYIDYALYARLRRKISL